VCALYAYSLPDTLISNLFSSQYAHHSTTFSLALKVYFFNFYKAGGRKSQKQKSLERNEKMKLTAQQLIKYQILLVKFI
jgi:hypothetical protein